MGLIIIPQIVLNQTVVVNMKLGQTSDVYIGRPSKWGNRHPVLRRCPHCLTGDQPVFHKRGEAIMKYEEDLLANAALLAQLPDLAGKRLGCFCAPQPCHGDMLIKYLRLRHGK